MNKFFLINPNTASTKPVNDNNQGFVGVTVMRIGTGA